MDRFEEINEIIAKLKDEQKIIVKEKRDSQSLYVLSMDWVKNFHGECTYNSETECFYIHLRAVSKEHEVFKSIRYNAEYSLPHNVVLSVEFMHVCFSAKVTFMNFVEKYKFASLEWDEIKNTAKLLSEINQFLTLEGNQE